MDGVVGRPIPRRILDGSNTCTKLCVSRLLLTPYCRQTEGGAALKVLHVARSILTSCCTEGVHENSIHPVREQCRWCELRVLLTSDHVLRNENHHLFRISYFKKDERISQKNYRHHPPFRSKKIRQGIHSTRRAVGERTAIYTSVEACSQCRDKFQMRRPYAPPLCEKDGI